MVRVLIFNQPISLSNGGDYTISTTASVPCRHPTTTRRWTDAGLRLAHRRRRCANLETASVLASAGLIVSALCRVSHRAGRRSWLRTRGKEAGDDASRDWGREEGNQTIYCGVVQGLVIDAFDKLGGATFSEWEVACAGVYYIYSTWATCKPYPQNKGLDLWVTATIEWSARNRGKLTNKEGVFRTGVDIKDRAEKYYNWAGHWHLTNWVQLL